jgi:hypothetical protein
MKRLVLVAAAAALAALLVPSASLAKGASAARITGPGLGNGIRLAGEGAPDGGTLMELAESAGFFPSVYVTEPNPMLTKRPKGSLGPRYRIAYVMPGPGGVASTLRQDLYPYAKPRPLSYMKPGQHFFATEKTVGGWFVAEPSLKRHLVALGLPRKAPAKNGLGVPALALVAAAVAAGALGAVRARRRPGPATT